MIMIRITIWWQCHLKITKENTPELTVDCNVDHLGDLSDDVVAGAIERTVVRAVREEHLQRFDLRFVAFLARACAVTVRSVSAVGAMSAVEQAAGPVADRSIGQRIVIDRFEGDIVFGLKVSNVPRQAVGWESLPLVGVKKSSNLQSLNFWWSGSDHNLHPLIKNQTIFRL